MSTYDFDLDKPAFRDEDAAREWLEASRWPTGPVCPFCKEQKSVKRLGGKSMGEGWYHCSECREKFTVRVGTLYERSHIALHKWLLATHLLCASKKGMSSKQLERMLGVTYKTAWFMTHRIREAMRVDGSAVPPLGGTGKIVEADETYFGKRDGSRPNSARKRYQPYTKSGKSGPAGKRAVVALVERGGRVRTFHPATADKMTVTTIVRDNIDRESRLHTDESLLYRGSDEHFAEHGTVKHSAGEYVRDDIHTNTVEGFFSIFKRGMRGIYQHCSEKHLHRYLAEYDFRYNHRVALGHSDIDRTYAAIRGAAGKRLTYKQPRPADIPF
jgi:transposase-like protein